MRELGLVGTPAADTHAAVFTTGHRSPIRQRCSGVATIPPDHQGIGRSSVAKAALQQSTFFVGGLESVPENRPITCRIRDPRNQS